MALRVEPRRVSPLRAAIPRAGSPPPQAGRAARVGAGQRRCAPCRFARKSDQGFAYIAEIQGPDQPAGRSKGGGQFPCPETAGFVSFAPWRKSPLDELTGTALTALRSDRFGRPDRHSGHPPRPMPAAEGLEVPAAARPPRQALRLCHVGRGDAAARSRAVVFAATAAPGELSHLPRRFDDRR